MTLSVSELERIRRSTEALGRGIGVRGLLNVQYALVSDVLYVLEANPRASRTVPFVSKATGVSLAKAAALVMAGHTIADLRASGVLPEHDGSVLDLDAPIAVKEAVLPFKRFRTLDGTVVDTVLGPEMRSTGEVMGFDVDFPTAFAKSQAAAYGGLPTSGSVFISVADRDKRAIVFPIKRLVELGFDILATEGTAGVLRRSGIPSRVVRKHSTGRGPAGADHRRPHPHRRGRHGREHPVRPGRPGRRLRDPHGDHRRGQGDRHDGPAARRGGAGHRGGPRRPVHRHEPPGARRRPRRARSRTGHARRDGGVSREPFGARLGRAMAAHGPLCVGIDPHPGLLAAWGLPDDAAGLRGFALRVMDAVGGHVAAVKPQSALFERHGSAGVAVLEEVVAAGRATGTLVVVDAKRGDIGSTMAGYADAYLRDGSPLAGDALTVSPYLGFGSLAPAVDAALATGRGLFVLALTSNPEGAAVQHAQGPDGRSVARVVAQEAAALNAAELAGADGADAREGGAGASALLGSPGLLGSVGLVVGATVGDAPDRLGLDLAGVRGPLLAPGVGAQGAGPAELARVFGDARPAVLASSSRGVLAAGPGSPALRDAARRAADDAAAALA